jgi:hypothetical protein
MTNRFLVYPPCHGLGVELHVLATAARLARLLDRTLVVPLSREAEAEVYGQGLDEIFAMPADLRWTSTERFQEGCAQLATDLVEVRPVWRRDYMDARVRREHPVWAAAIASWPYLRGLGLRIERRAELAPRRPLSEAAAARALASDAAVLAVTYINGLLVVDTDVAASDGACGAMFAAEGLSARAQRDAIVRLGRKPRTAIHVRRGLPASTLRILGCGVPSVDMWARYLTSDDAPVYVATDTPQILPLLPTKLKPWRLEGRTPLDGAILDLAACVLAQRFVGTYASTFSVYALYAREVAGARHGVLLDHDGAVRCEIGDVSR